jgi:uncharacterized protein (TIGR03000 family)
MRSVLLTAVLSLTGLGLFAGQLSAAPPEPAPATIDVALPADAQLTIDGQVTSSTSGHRRFITPSLKPGTSYSYAFTAKLVRGGKTITLDQAVGVRAGRETYVSLDLPGEAAAGADRPKGYRSTYGAGPENNSSYLAQATAGLDLGTRWRSATQSEDRPYSPGFNPIHWGQDPSGPFSHGSEW